MRLRQLPWRWPSSSVKTTDLPATASAARRQEASDLFDVGDQDLGQQAARLAGDQIDVEADQDLADFDLFALAHLRRESLALEQHGIDADMQQHFDALLGGDGQRVVGLVQLGDRAGHRRQQLARGGVEGNAVADHLLGKDRIGYRFEWNQDAGEWGYDFESGCGRRHLSTPVWMQIRSGVARLQQLGRKAL